MADISGGFCSLVYESGTKIRVTDGVDAVLPPYGGGTLFKGANANYKFYPVPTGPQYHYRMRAWNTVTAGWEIWTSVGTPDVNPPSGDPVTNVTLIGITEEV